jgi:hypothetical protein
VKREWRWTWFGVGYGCVLWVFAFGSAGMGHGTFLPFGIYDAPLSLIPFATLLVTPVWWGALGVTFTKGWRRTAVVMMVLHTIAAGVIYALGTPMEHGNDRWEYFAKAQRALPGWVWTGICIYFAGTLAAWAVTLNLWRSNNEQDD